MNCNYVKQIFNKCINQEKKYIIQRFLKNLRLPKKCTVVINKIEELNTKRFITNSIELYHTIDSFNQNDIIKSIKYNGLRPGSACNKGYGVYLSSHSKYSLLWQINNPVIVCDVLYDKNKVKRYRAEVGNGKKDEYEYVISQPNLIIPKYIFYFFLLFIRF